MSTPEDVIRAAYARRQHDSKYSFFNTAHRLCVQQREQVLLTELSRHGITDLQEKRVLDVGCGAGWWLLDFIKWGAAPESLNGVDLIPTHIQQAKARLPS